MSDIKSLFTDLVHATYAANDGKYVDNISLHQAALRELRRKGRVVDVDGGESIEKNPMLTENNTIENYVPGQPLNTNASPVVTKAKFPWGQKAMHVTMDGPTLKKNRGKNQLISLAKMKAEQASITAGNRLAIELYSDGSIFGSIMGLRTLFSADGMGVVGGIDAANYSNWKNQAARVPAGDILPAKIRRTFSSVIIRASVGTTRPDIALVTNDIYLNYQDSIVANIRYMDKDKADGSIDNLVHDGVSIIHDINADYFGEAGQTAFILNSRHIELFQHPQAKFKPRGFRSRGRERWYGRHRERHCHEGRDGGGVRPCAGRARCRVVGGGRGTPGVAELDGRQGARRGRGCCMGLRRLGKV